MLPRLLMPRSLGLPPGGRCFGTRLAVQRGRATLADIKLGICGKHGGDPASIAFCE